MGKLYAYDGSDWIEISKDGTNGTNGTNGAAATISVGTTTTLDAGNNATVTNSGTSSAAVLAFGIPKGADGSDGTDGNDGAVWYTGSGAPSTTHNDGDLYLNTSNGDVYKQTSGSWGSSIANLTGPQGSAGSASGSDTQVQFNDGGSFAGDSGLTYNKTTNALTISGDLSANNVSGTNTGDQTTITGNAGTATKLQTARTIGGVSFDGSANITLPGVNESGTQDTTGNAATATKLETARNINGVSFDGSADINAPMSSMSPLAVSVSTAASTVAKVGTTSGGSYSPAIGDVLLVTFSAANTASNPTLNIDSSGAIAIKLGGQNPSNIGMTGTTVLLYYDGTYYEVFGSQRISDSNTTYSAMSVAEGEAGTATTSRTMRADYLQTIIQYYVDNALSTMNSDVIYGWQ